MKIERYDKLVRDRIPDIITNKGLVPVIRIANDADYAHRLYDKLQEEVGEFLASGDPAELADILEVVEALALDKGLGWRDLMRMKRDKRRERGGFRKRIVLDEVRDAR